MPLFNWFKEKGKSMITKSHENIWFYHRPWKRRRQKLSRENERMPELVRLGNNEGGFELNTPTRNCNDFKSILQYLYSIVKWLIKIRRLKTFLYNPQPKIKIDWGLTCLSIDLKRKSWSFIYVPIIIKI